MSPRAKSELGPCPICGAPLFGWIATAGPDGGERVLDRCELCGVVVHREAGPIDLEQELAALGVSGTAAPAEIELPNRRSVQASLGEGRWAAIDSGSLLHTPDSLTRLLARDAISVEDLGFPPWAGQRDMHQTLLNALTFRDNFARDALAGRIRPRGLRQRAAYAIDALVSVLATPLVAVVSIPLEAIAALLGRGGRMRARVTRLPS